MSVFTHPRTDSIGADVSIAQGFLQVDGVGGHLAKSKMQEYGFEVFIRQVTVIRDKVCQYPSFLGPSF